MKAPVLLGVSAALSDRCTVCVTVPTLDCGPHAHVLCERWGLSLTAPLVLAATEASV